MIILAKLVSYVGLLLTLVPSVLLLIGSSLLDDYSYKLLATVGMVLWFVTAPFWVNRAGSE